MNTVTKTNQKTHTCTHTYTYTHTYTRTHVQKTDAEKKNQEVRENFTRKWLNARQGEFESLGIRERERERETNTNLRQFNGLDTHLSQQELLNVDQLFK
jgi:hypothetical protein